MNTPDHPLYAATERLLARSGNALSLNQLEQLYLAFRKAHLRLPLDLAAALMGAGYILSPSHGD